jgi:hypothetical protein
MIKLFKKDIFGKVYTNKNIVPDIAGRFDELSTIVNQFGGDYISLGDINDRGFQSKQVFDFFMQENHKTIFANHEHLMVDFYRANGFYDDIRWFSNGGIPTLLSFSNLGEQSFDLGYIQDWVLHYNQVLNLKQMRKLDFMLAKDQNRETCKAKFDEIELIRINAISEIRNFTKEKINETYIKFIEASPKFIKEDGLLLTHAPINPSLKWDQILDIGTSAKSARCNTSIIWNRGTPKRIPDLIQIHGHISQNQPSLYMDKSGCFGLNLDGSRGNKLFVYIGSEDSIYYVDYQLDNFYPNIKIIE